MDVNQPPHLPPAKEPPQYPEPQPEHIVHDTTPTSQEEGTSALLAEFTRKLEENTFFKIHTAVAFVGCLGLTIIWLFLALFIHMFPWFIFPWSVAIVSVSGNFFLLRKKGMLPFHLCVLVSLNLTLFLIWMASSAHNKGTDAWFLYPLFVSLFFYNVHAESNANTNGKLYLLFRVHVLFTVFLNLLCFTIFLQHRTFPWVVIVLVVSIFFLGLHYISRLPQMSLLLVHIFVFTMMQTLFFFIWLSTGFQFPWFAFILVAWGIVLGLHIVLDRKRRRGEDQDTFQVLRQEPSPQRAVSTDSFSAYDYNQGQYIDQQQQQQQHQEQHYQPSPHPVSQPFVHHQGQQAGPQEHQPFGQPPYPEAPPQHLVTENVTDHSFV